MIVELFHLVMAGLDVSTAFMYAEVGGRVHAVQHEACGCKHTHTHTHVLLSLEEAC